MAESKPNIKNMPSSVRFDHQHSNAEFAIWHVNAGEGLPKHEHTFPHAVLCTAGKIAVRKENIYLEMDKETTPVDLRENEWHEIEALVDGTTFINIYPLDKSKWEEVK